jgi:hypothetical protein
VRLTWVHLVLRPLLACCTSSGWSMMIMEQLVEWGLAGETEVLGENLPQCHFVHHKSHMTWDRTRAAAVGIQRLTALAMARPSTQTLTFSLRIYPACNDFGPTVSMFPNPVRIKCRQLGLKSLFYCLFAWFMLISAAVLSATILKSPRILWLVCSAT